MPETVKTRVENYTMKMQLYPSESQKQQIDRILRALQVAYNMTFHQVFLQNPDVCTAPKADGSVWPDFKKMAKAQWVNHLAELNPAINDAPRAAITTNNGLFLHDARQAWKAGLHDLPLGKAKREDFRFYNANYPRSSFMIQLDAKRIKPSPENPKVAWLTVTGVDGVIKARGFNRKIWFGKNGAHTYEEAVLAGEMSKDLTVRVSKDNCGDYFISVTFFQGKTCSREIWWEAPAAVERSPVGVDVGIKDLAILSSGEKIANPHFKKEKDAVLRRLDRKLTRRWGPVNPAFRDYNKMVRAENRLHEDEPEQRIPLAIPSKRYQAVRQKKAEINRKIARRRETYYHQQTAVIVRQSSLLATETLKVKNMMRNHKLAYSLSDAAMSDFLSKLDYKAQRQHVPLLTIGTFEPSSQRCSVCRAINPAVKDTAIREWTCPSCGTFHDRDINAARNILAIAQETGGTADDVIKEPRKKEEDRHVARRTSAGQPRTAEASAKKRYFPGRSEHCCPIQQRTHHNE